MRYDAETGLYWLGTRAYDPTLGRFISRDPLGRVPLLFADQPYAYAGNNPLVNVDPSGQMRMAGYSPRTAPPAPQPTRTVTRGGGGPTVTPCSRDRKCMARYKRWKEIIDFVFNGTGAGGFVADIYMVIRRGPPAVKEFFKLFGAGDVAALGPFVEDATDVLFALSDIARNIAFIMGAAVDSGVMSAIRGVEVFFGTLKGIASLIGGLFSFANPFQRLEDWAWDKLRPILAEGAIGLLKYLAVHLGAFWLPQMLGLMGSSFDSLTPDQAVSRYGWIRDWVPPGCHGC